MRRFIRWLRSWWSDPQPALAALDRDEMTVEPEGDGSYRVEWRARFRPKWWACLGALFGGRIDMEGRAWFRPNNGGGGEPERSGRPRLKVVQGEKDAA